MQQINLYTEEFRPKRVVLTLDQIVLLGVVIIVILFGANLLADNLLASRQAELATKQHKLETLRKQVERMQERANGLVLDESLVAANSRLTVRLRARTDLLDMLGRVVVQHNDNFSSALVALARQRSDGLWLTRITLSASGRAMTLEGRTQQGESVPQYLQKLRDEPAFAGRTFSLFNLSLDDESSGEKQAGPLSFSLKSEANDQFKPFAVADQDNRLVSPEEERHLLEQMKGVKP